MTDNQTCPKCNNPVKPGTKFCESCGARIETPPACPKCGAAISPNAKFCESCGESIVPAAVPAAVAPAPEEKRAAPEQGIKPEDKPIMAVSPAPKEPVSASKPAEQAKGSSPKPASSNTTIIIAGIVVLALLGALVYFVGLPLLSGSGSAPAGVSAPAIPGASPANPASPVTSPSDLSTQSQSGTASFSTEPTQIPPANLLVTFQAERDPISGIVTITFTGGAGRYGVKNVDIRLTRSDGQVISRTVTISEIGDGLTLQGTKTGDDRIELTANYNNGEHYKIIDKILEYKRRNW